LIALLEYMKPQNTRSDGIGRNHRWTGMIRTLFMPSDDSTRLPYFVPSNAFAVTELRATARLLRNISNGSPDEALAHQAVR
jgi:meiotically up-regulated gene 157 (Mug157) protein